MFTLYLALFVMLVLALIILAIPFYSGHFRKSFFILSLIVILFSISMYLLTGNKYALREWLTHGKEHYELLTEYQQLGGIDGMIAKISSRLKAQPNDAQGWYILGKLYLMKHDNISAQKALKKAHTLKPDDGQIEYFYKAALKK